ncbi:MAG: endonuclease MutS2 [Eubacteriales bacterium]|nr:endonuclease MutS2 [Eubacteriales bacterium]
MNEKVLKTLEYDKIIDKLEEYASSTMGKKMCRELLPSSDFEEVQNWQEETRDALTRLYKNGFLSFQGLMDIHPHLRLLEIESTLTAKELLDIARILSLTAHVKEYGDTEDETLAYDCLAPQFNLLEPLEFLYLSITRCILSADEISDDASANLREIRKEIKQTNISIHNKLASIINAQSNKTILQDALITMRNGRYCVPVKSEYKSTFQGMIHDQSSSGSTLFIEPMVVVNLNNRLKELDIEEQAEIEKILKNLSVQVAANIRDIEENLKILTNLDFVFAKAKYAKEYMGTEPIFNTDGIVDIKQARHPLLDPKKVVPIHIYIGEDFNMLLLTGPNTGGKTVSLKTVGLFQLMGQAGLHIPAFQGSRLAIFSDIFADIGDEQSIEMNLSTFSSHMTNIINIVKEAQPDSLILFDELCGGTDPTEGAALAIAILDDLHSAKIRTIATTHYAELKMYAMNTPGVENGCCEFDLETLSPTYRLLIGIPGKSNAFAISKRLGLPDYIIDQAVSQIDANAIDFEVMLSELEKNKAEIEREQAELIKTRQEIDVLKLQLKERQDDIKEKRANMLREAREEALKIVSDAKEMADESIRKFNAWGQHPGQNNTKKMEAQRSNLRGKMNKLEKQMAYKTKKASTILSPQDFKVGDAVFVTSLSLEGTVKEAANKNGDLIIQMGFLSSTVNYKNLELREKPKEAKTPASAKDKYSINKSASIKTEINLLGNTVDEAINQLEKYLDDAMIAGLTSVRVVHGKGTGALRKGIHEYLRRQKFVKSYKLAEFGEGDAGVTIVTFK